MWHEQNDWMIRDDNNGKFQCDALRYGKFEKTGKRTTFESFSEALNFVKNQAVSKKMER